MEKQSIPRNIHFNLEQIKLGEKIAKPLGMSFNTWVKYLVMKELEAFAKFENLKIKSEDQSLEIQKSEELKERERLYLMAGLDVSDASNDKLDEQDSTLPY